MDGRHSESTSETRTGLTVFSVVIPNYNRSESVLRSVASVLAQTFAEFEVIVVDDGSSDDSVARLREIDDPRLIVIKQDNAGASAARNRGIDYAIGEFIAFLDSDDTYCPNHLASLLPLLRREPHVAAYSQIFANRGSGRLMIKPPRAIGPNEDMATYLMCDRGFIQTSGLALSRIIARKIRYREDVSFGDDVDFAVRLQLAGCRFIMSEIPTVVWTDDARPDRLSQPGTQYLDPHWLEDLRPHIPPKAYYGYCGWHVAKALWPERRLAALRSYFSAVVRGAYGPRLALIILLQLCVPGWLYREIADHVIAMQFPFRRLSHEQAVALYGGLRGSCDDQPL